MPDQPKRGKRVQIYLPADLLERWGQTPRYERSATVAAALREYWKNNAPRRNSHTDSQTDQKVDEQKEG